jgi:hypothetical protein
MGDKMNDKDQAAIDHVASVSKNPHAAMIVKQLITGWYVEVNQSGEWITLDGGIKPSWSENCEYRLIEPKPAYRVYKNKRNEHTFTIDRIGGLIASKLPKDDDAILIHDWIEYDPPKKWPTPLVERIAAIDLEAAEWIVDHWDDLLDGKYTHGSSEATNGTLITMFAWDMTTHGEMYWREISTKLGEE